MTKFTAMAQRLRKLAIAVSEEYPNLDTGGSHCDCCGAFSYRNFPQKQMADRVKGVVERLTEMAETLERRADDPGFLAPPPRGTETKEN